MTNGRTGNADICAVLSGLVALEALDRDDRASAAANGDVAAPALAGIGPVPGIGSDSLEHFLLDHAHHADRLPRLLAELRAPRAA